MPVRGKGWYKRPYRVHYTDRDGNAKQKAYHWVGAAQREVQFLLDLGYRDVRLETVGPEFVDRANSRRRH